MDVQFVSSLPRSAILFPPFSYMIFHSIIGLVTPSMLNTISWGTYIFFAAFCLLALAFTFFFIPETRGKVRPTYYPFIYSIYLWSLALDKY